MAENQPEPQIASKSSREACSDPGLKATLIKHCSLLQHQKLCIYKILKRLLQEPNSLWDGKWDTEDHSEERFRLVYRKERCEVSTIDARGFALQHWVVATLDIYLRWNYGEFKELLTLQNLQRVQTELRFLGVENEKLDDCFHLAKHEFLKEPMYGMKHSCVLQIICDEFILSFLSGSGGHKITVLYDDKKNTAVYYIAK